MKRTAKEVDYGENSGPYYHGRGVSEEFAGGSGAARSKGGLFGVFRNNPSLMIILVDIMVIVLVLTLVLPFIRRKSSVDNFAAHDLSLHGFVYGEKATVSLIITSVPGDSVSTVSEGAAKEAAGKEGAAKEELSPLFSIRFILLDKEGEPAVERKVEARPPELGKSRVVRVELDNPGASKKVRVEVRYEGEDVSLQKELTSE